MNLLRCKTSKHRFLWITAIWVMQSLRVIGQTGGLSGTIRDAATKEPVPFATVFLSSTLFGTRAKEDGTYRLEQIPFGKYELTVSSVGYQLSSIVLVISATDQRLIVDIKPDVKVLKEVVVQAKSSEYLEQYRRNLKRFKNLFLGETYNAEKCTILNIDDINLDFDDHDEVLSASCDKPIIIENKALGYRVLYLLKEFRADFSTKYCVLTGIAHFEEIKSTKNSQRRKWRKERSRAYFGSMVHFMRALKYSCLSEEKFQVYELTPAIKLNHVSAETITVNDTSYQRRAIHESEVLRRQPNVPLRLLVIYKGEQQEYHYDRGRGANLQPQASVIKFPNRPMKVYDNGYYEDSWGYYLSGYLGWATKVGEMIPLEYLPWREEEKDGPLLAKNGSSGPPADGALDSATSVRSADGLNSFHGNVLDEATKKPIPGASLFLSNTLIKTIASPDGRYLLEKIPGGPYNLTVTATGYEIITVPVLLRGTRQKADWLLKRSEPLRLEGDKPLALETTIVKKYLNGVTENSRKCKITNIDDLMIRYDAGLKIITARASLPLDIDNYALGYHLHCWLRQFTFDEQASAYSTDGVISMDEMTPRDGREVKQWEERRRRAWNGSFEHFMSSLKGRVLEKNDFKVFRLEGGTEIPVEEEWLLSDRLEMPVKLKVIYNGEPPEVAFEGKAVSEYGQTSLVTLTKELINSFPNEYINNPGHYEIKGYFNYTNVLAEKLPLEYGSGLKSAN